MPGTWDDSFHLEHFLCLTFLQTDCFLYQIGYVQISELNFSSRGNSFQNQQKEVDFYKD